ncbi:hypothetical protein [Agarivorans aestuarii]|uniref:Uncharacterized protein n=1 Tax=Agarivorans aestuarii TaxID=1563703 RepID=A0ABU7G0S6_9ALTE|nr:hypothetical protein [Agarivorans aestuarii]MEE1672860.1 hypothetical protein [Agarivorans aestuarii]
MTEKVETRGRKKTSEIDKARSRASRDHKLYQETLTEEFEQLQRDKELQFAESEKRMGRPPVKLATLQRRALDKYKTSLEVYREVEAKESVEPWHESDIIGYKVKDKAGRKKADEIERLKKYIRRQVTTIQKIEAEDESEFGKEHDGSGRPGMTKSQKIRHYEKLIEKANIEITEILMKKTKAEQLEYQLKDVRVMKRTYRTAYKAKNGKFPESSPQDEMIEMLERKIELAKKEESLDIPDVGLYQEPGSSRSEVKVKATSINKDELAG